MNIFITVIFYAYLRRNRFSEADIVIPEGTVIEDIFRTPGIAEHEVETLTASVLLR